MRGEFIHQIYIADGFDLDCDMLIQRCIRTDRLNFETFSEIWKDMKFDSLYIGRSSAVEIAELSEELIHTAKQYMLANVSNYEETVAGVFLVYGLLSLQPYSNFAVLRLVPSDVPIIKRIEMIARRDKRRDVLFILGSILIKHAAFHAEQRERGIEPVYCKYWNGYIGIDKLGFRPRGSFHRQTEELDVIRELSGLTDRYESAKKAVTGGRLDPSLSFINTRLPSELDCSLKKLISGVTGNEEEDDINEADVHYSSVQQIKDKAMRKAVGGMKHLTSAVDRTTKASEMKTVSEIKSKPGKVKTNSPTKATSSPRKSPRNQAGNTSAKATEATTKPMKRKLRKIKRKSKKSKIESDSSSDSDVDINDITQDDDDDISDEELHIDMFDKPNDVAETRADTEIDKLPSRITTEVDGKVYDIEIIDQHDKNNDQSVVVGGSGVKMTVFKKPKAKGRMRKPTMSLTRLGLMPGDENNKHTDIGDDDKVDKRVTRSCSQSRDPE
ncbi:snRNA-activating protein complex subunit 1-like [Plodia interpunctella]|uniref:snRNA-activating protein complex subunit 1-like n=1 Tax=Plodia interpunctella TaxID=58824 RepID=UPI0023678049|nr:snRNA-activating protein complex subunit 1-like [Plodia interpunctella]